MEDQKEEILSKFENINPSDNFNKKPNKIGNSKTDFMEVESTNEDSTYIQTNSNINKFKPYLSLEDANKFDEFLHIKKKLEELHKVKINYLSFQKEMNLRKRFILLDWIMEVCYQFHFWRRTYFSCINLIDIYLTKCKVITNQIQLVGIACLLISAKNEETEIPKLSYFALVCQNYYTKNEILKKESEILAALKWKIQYINLIDIVDIFTLKWDNIIQTLNKDQNNDDKFPLFRNDPQYKYLLLVNIYHFLDYLSLDYYFNFYNEKYLCVAMAYIIIGVLKNIFSYNDAINSFNKANIYNTDKIKNYKKNFFGVCEKYLSIKTVDILEELKYVCIFSGIIFGTSSDNVNKNIKLNDDENIQLQKYNEHNYVHYKRLEQFRKEDNIN